MRQIFDSVLLQHYLDQYHIPSFFDTPELPFQLWEYAPGEMMNLLHRPEEYLKFVVAGSFQICEVRADGSWYPLGRADDRFTLLGDMEFCGYREESHYQQVIQRVLTVELPLHRLRTVLMNDKSFLRYLLRVFCDKLAKGHNALDSCTLEEKTVALPADRMPSGQAYRHRRYGFPSALQPQSAPAGIAGTDGTGDSHPGKERPLSPCRISRRCILKVGPILGKSVTNGTRQVSHRCDHKENRKEMHRCRMWKHSSGCIRTMCIVWP